MDHGPVSLYYMSSYTISEKAYFKLFFHAAKHPHRQVNGVLVGKKEGAAVIIEDAIPLLHHWTSLSPMMEIGLDLVSCDESYSADVVTLIKSGRAIYRIHRAEPGGLLSSE